MTFRALAIAVLVFESIPATAADPVAADVVVYAGTPAGITAAIAAAKRGHTVALIEPNARVGGVVSGGLVDTDTGDRATIGGIADDFFKRTEAHYREKYGLDSRQYKACHAGLKYEPHVAEAVFEAMLKEQPKVTVYRQHRLRSLVVKEGKITALTIDNLPEKTSREFTGTVVIDASYTGDVMAACGVPYRVGREGRAEYQETLAGVWAGPKEQYGFGDHRTQAYNYRVSITSNPANRVLFPKPEHYDPEPWRKTYGVRVIRQGLTGFGQLYVNAAAKAGPNDKFDTNWGDMPGANDGYADADHETRARIEAKHRDYFLSMLYYLQNDPELPAVFREEARNWGLPKDEFEDTGHFPFQIYVREARRMLGRYVLTENDLTTDRWKSDGVCSGSYGIDCHVIRRVPVDGKEVPDHTPHAVVHPYDIPYRCLTPHEPGNLLVPVCLSTTHVAYCSLRMEPVFMMLGHACGTAAHLAITNKSTVQKVDTESLRTLLRKEGAVLDAGYQPQVRIAWSPARPRPGEKVRFQAVSSNLKEPLTEIWWDFEGTGQVSAKGESAGHVFELDKTYTVGLVVEDKARRRRLVTAAIPVGSGIAGDVSLTDYDAELAGRWQAVLPKLVAGRSSVAVDVFTGPSAHQDMVLKGKTMPARARYQPEISRAGRYAVCLGFRPSKGLATNVPVTIRHAGGTEKLTVNQREDGSPFPFKSLGVFTFKPGKTSFVEVANGGADGRVMVDGIRLVWVGE